MAKIRKVDADFVDDLRAALTRVLDVKDDSSETGYFVDLLTTLAEETAARKDVSAHDRKELLALRSQLHSSFEHMREMGLLATREHSDAVLNALEAATGIGVLHRGSPIKDVREALEKARRAAHARAGRTSKSQEMAKKVREIAAPVVAHHKNWSLSHVEKKIRPELNALYGKDAPARSTVIGWLR